MEPVSPYNFWSSTTQESYNTTPTSSSRMSYDVGNVMIAKKPINLASVPKYSVHDYSLRKESVTSSLFSSDIWLSTSSSDLFTRRMVPCNRILPPLEMPKPNLTESSDEFWPTKTIIPGKFSLPPIDMPSKCKRKRGKVSMDVISDESVKIGAAKSEKTDKVVGVKKVRRRVKLSGVRRMVTCLMQRAVKGKLKFYVIAQKNSINCFKAKYISSNTFIYE